MKITTEHKVEALGDGKTSRLTVFSFIDGKYLGSHTALSGPTEDVQDYMEGKATLDELDQRWREKKVGGVRARDLPVRAPRAPEVKAEEPAKPADGEPTLE